jgi:hypothetical protein
MLRAEEPREVEVGVLPAHVWIGWVRGGVAAGVVVVV